MHNREKGWLAFWGVITIYAIEYIGLGNYVPGVQRLPLFLSFFILLSMFFSKNMGEVLKYGQTKALVIFFLHSFLSIAYAIVGTYAFNVVKVQIGYIFLFAITYFVLTSKQKVHILIGAFIFYLSFIIIANFEKMKTTERIGGFRAGYFLSDGNDLSWSLIIFLPFSMYFFSVARNKLIKGVIIVTFFLFFFGIVGTASRGAFLGLIASIAYLILNSPKKAVAIIITAIIGIIAFMLAPGGYTDRIGSIGSYQEDSSALGRIMAWKASIRMATSHPFGVGAGNFNTAYGRYYRPTEIDPRIWRGARWISPHSIYFLVLGEYGIIGFTTIMALLALNYRDNQRQVNFIKKMMQRNASNRDKLSTLPKYLNMSLVAFAVGGIFLGGLNYPHIYVLTALILKTRQINEENKSGKLIG